MLTRDLCLVCRFARGVDDGWHTSRTSGGINTRWRGRTHDMIVVRAMHDVLPVVARRRSGVHGTLHDKQRSILLELTLLHLHTSTTLLLALA